MSDTGRPRTSGAPKKKPSGAARPASSSSMRDGVTARMQDDGSVPKVASEENDTAADTAKPEETVRIRTSAGDQPWKQQPAKDGDKPGDTKPVTGAEPTAPFSKPAAARSTT